MPGYENVRGARVIESRAVQVAIGIDWEGPRQVLAVELANRESEFSWKDLFGKLKARTLSGVGSWFPTTTPDDARRCGKRPPMRPGSAARCIFRAMSWTAY